MVLVGPKWPEHKQAPPRPVGPRRGEDTVTPHTRPPADEDADHVLVRTAQCIDGRVEIDLVCEDGDELAFVEVKTRSSEEWSRPAAAVDARKKRLISQTALDYLRLIKTMWFEPAEGGSDKPAVEVKAIAYGAALFSFPLVLVALIWLDPLAKAAAALDSVLRDPTHVMLSLDELAAPTTLPRT